MDSSTRARIDRLGLTPHPEGGSYREVFRAAETTRDATGAVRSVASHILFLLAEGEHSRWHRIGQNELWHFYEGSPVELVWLEREVATLNRVMLGLASQRHDPCAHVPAGCWQTARTRSGHALMGCTVTPAFEFADFELMADDANAMTALRGTHPYWVTYV